MSAVPEFVSEVKITAVDGYKPSGKLGPLGIPLLLLSLLLLPPILGFLYVKTGHFGGMFFSSIYVLVGTALVLGVVVGGAFFPAVQFGKVRNTTLITIVGLLAGLATFGAAMTIEAVEHRQSVEAIKSGTQLGLPEIVSSYWSHVAEGGIQVTGRRSRSANISGGMFWGLTALQGLLCTLAAGVVPSLIAGRRFSEDAQQWFASKGVYSILPKDLPAVIAAARAGDWPQLRQISEASKDPNFKEYKPPVTVYYLPGTPGGILEIKAIPPDEKGGYTRTVFEQKLSPEEIKAVWPAYPDATSGPAAFDVKAA